MPVGYPGTSTFKRLRVNVEEEGFWMGRQFGISYRFDITARKVLKFQTQGDVILRNASVEVVIGDLDYNVYAFPNDGIETAAFTNSIDSKITPLNTTSFALDYTRQTAAWDDGDIDETGLEPFPTLIVTTADNSNFRQTAGATPGQVRGFGAGNAYVVLSPFEGSTRVVGVLDFRFEERDWGY